MGKHRQDNAVAMICEARWRQSMNIKEGRVHHGSPSSRALKRSFEKETNLLAWIRDDEHLNGIIAIFEH